MHQLTARYIDVKQQIDIVSSALIYIFVKVPPSAT